MSHDFKTEGILHKQCLKEHWSKTKSVGILDLLDSVKIEGILMTKYSVCRTKPLTMRKALRMVICSKHQPTTFKLYI